MTLDEMAVTFGLDLGVSMESLCKRAIANKHQTDKTLATLKTEAQAIRDRYSEDV